MMKTFFLASFFLLAVLVYSGILLHMFNGKD